MALTRNTKELKVYQEAFPISLEVHKSTLEFPKIEHYALGDQMRRASNGICANLTEGFARQAESYKEFRRYVVMAAGSVSEMYLWCEYAKALGYIKGPQAAKWLDKYDHISRMLHKLRVNIESSNQRVLESANHRR